MKNFQRLIFGICIMSIPFLNSCGDNDPDPCNYSDEIEDELNAVLAAQDAYIADPTNSSKCNAYKVSLNEYVDALEDNADCVLDSQQEAYDQALDSAQASINAIQC